MKDLKENQKVRITFKMEDGCEKYLHCSLKSFLGDRIVLNYPAEAVFYAKYLREGEDVKVEIFTPSGVKTFFAVILDAPVEHDFTIEFVEDCENIQRRRYPRVNYKTKLIIQRTRGNVVTNTVDLSAGAVRFESDIRFAEREAVTCMIFFSQQSRSVHCKGIVVKKEHLLQNEYILLFTEINELEKVYIDEFCLKIIEKEDNPKETQAK